MEGCGCMRYEDFTCGQCYAYRKVDRLPVAKFGIAERCTLLPDHQEVDFEHYCLTGYLYTRSMKLCDMDREHIEIKLETATVKED